MESNKIKVISSYHIEAKTDGDFCSDNCLYLFNMLNLTRCCLFPIKSGKKRLLKTKNRKTKRCYTCKDVFGVTCFPGRVLVCEEEFKKDDWGNERIF